MRRTIELDGGDWTVEGFLGLDAARRAAAQPASSQRPAAIPASVPGSIVDDLWRAGRVPDPYVGLNSLAIEWVPERAWLYRRAIDMPALRPEQRSWLGFDGLDHAGEVFWDGESIGRHAGMFVPFELDLSERLRGATAGGHEVAVVVEPAPDSEPQLGRTSRVRVHKSRMSYGWDFCPRMVHQGLWQSVRLEVVDDVRIVDVWARPTLSEDLRTASVEARVMLDTAAAGTVRIEVQLDGANPAAAASTLDLQPGRSEAVLHFDVRDPGLWWPNGLGPAVVHRLRARVIADGGALDEASVPIGFRSIERVPNEGAQRHARPWTWIVNGRRMYVRGWNWVPDDALYGVPRSARMRHLLRLARDAHANLLRVWGGGLIETRAFYEACDEMGLLVWQELSQSSSGTDSVPSTDPEFVELMAAEARAIVPLRRNHPSLAVWCGGNELEGPDGPLDDSSPVLAALRDVVLELDPGRAWLPTSPSGPKFANRLDAIEEDPRGLHDVHGPWEHQGLEGQHELYDRGTSLFNSEFGVEGMTNRRSHEALIPSDERWPPTRANRLYRHLGDWWINAPLVQAAFGGRLADLEAVRRASQHLQAEGLRYAVEANRRRAFRNSGSIPWQLNESYPNAWCTSAIDHRGDPKLAYHAVRRAYAPVVVAAAYACDAWGGANRFEATIWAWSDGEPRPGLEAVARLVDVGGSVLAETSLAAELPPDTPARLGEISLAAPLPPLFLLDLALIGPGEALATNRYVCSGGDDLSALLDVPAVSITAEVAADGDAWRVRLSHRNGPAALGLRLEDDRPIEAHGWAEVADSGFHLLPGEARTIGIRWTDADEPAVPRRLRLSGWNVADSTVPPS